MSAFNLESASWDGTLPNMRLIESVVIETTWGYGQHSTTLISEHRSSSWNTQTVTTAEG